MALGRNIEYLRKLANLGRPDIARAIDKDNAVKLAQAIYALEERDSVRSEFSPALAGFFNVPLNVLLEKDLVGLSLDQIRAMGQAPAVDFDRNVVTASMGGARPIPVISLIQAGKLKEITDPYEPGDGYAVLYSDDSLSRWAFALEIDGHSMTPDFQPGDRVIIEPDWQPRPGDFVAARNGAGEATFKKYRPRGTDAAGNQIFELVPLNEDYETLRSDQTPLQIIGVMAEHRRRPRRR